MNDIISSQDGTPISLKHKPNARVKRMSIRFSPKDGQFILSYPPYTSQRALTKFMDECKAWVEKHARNLTPATTLISQKEISLFGTPFQCQEDLLRKRPALCKTSQTLFLPKCYLPENVVTLFKKEALEILSPLVQQPARKLGHQVEKITIRDQSTRWGSCSANKTISLNWRLLLAPPEVATYVCVHEVAHLEHMNHSKAFWGLVEKLHPSYKPHRKWLKENGKSLMSFRIS